MEGPLPHPPAPALLDGRRRASDILLAIAYEDSSERISVGTLFTELGDRTFGMALVFLGLLNAVPMPPGFSAITGSVIMLVALQLIIGRHRLWLPGFFTRRSMLRADFRTGVERLAPVMRRVETLFRPRFAFLTEGVAERLIGVFVFGLAFVIFLPIPVVGNIPPAIAIIILAHSLIERDGLAMLAGLAAGTLAVVLIWKLIVAAVGALIQAIGLQG
jgi:hypothetical protein